MIHPVLIESRDSVTCTVSSEARYCGLHEITAPLTTAEVPASQWDMHWQPCRARFQIALQSGDVQQAWELLSTGAEQVLHPQGHISRADFRGPCNSPSTKALTLQTLPERQLRRVARRLAEYQRTADPTLERKLRRDLARLDFTLLVHSLTDPGLLQSLWDKAACGNGGCSPTCPMEGSCSRGKPVVIDLREKALPFLIGSEVSGSHAGVLGFD